MSSELMKSKFVSRPSSVRVAIITVPNVQISFNFWLLPPLGHSLGLFPILKKQKLFGIFYEPFWFSLTWDHGGQNFKPLLHLQIVAETFYTSPEFSSFFSSFFFFFFFFRFL